MKGEGRNRSRNTAAAKLLQSSPTLCDPAPSSAPSSSVLSFSLIYFVCSLLSAGRNVSFPLSCAVCACVSLGQFLVKVSCWEGLVQVL